jgi:uncharacterized membrane protein YeaQ/YmgE (transglycosylase-associated protein family)
MNVTIWLSAAAAAGWIACSILDLNTGRAVIVSAIIGVVGAVYGGDAMAPPFSGNIGSTGVLTPFAVLLASIGAIACLKIVDIVFAPPPPPYCLPLEHEQ